VQYRKLILSIYFCSFPSSTVEAKSTKLEMLLPSHSIRSALTSLGTEFLLHRVSYFYFGFNSDQLGCDLPAH